MKLPYIFESHSYASFAINCLIPKVEEAIERYGYVTVAYVYDYLDKLTGVLENTTSKHTDIARGWTSMDDFFAKVYCTRHWGWSEYGIEVTEPKIIE